MDVSISPSDSSEWSSSGQEIDAERKVLGARDLTIESDSGAVGQSGTPIIRGVSFKLVAGESLGIAGESGSGKTTIVQSLFGHVRPGMRSVKGIIDVGGRHLSLHEPEAFKGLRGRTLALVPQSADAMLNPIMTIQQQLSEICRVRGLTHRGSIDERIGIVLRDVGLQPPDVLLSRYPHELSGGQRQRVVLSMALIAEPDFLILDEATSDLDVITQLRILKLIRELQNRHGFGLVVVSHDLRILAALCSELLVMYTGLVVETGPLESVFQHPAHPYTAQLVRRFREGPSATVPGEQSGEDAGPEPPVGCNYRRECPMAEDRCSTIPPLIETDFGASRCWFTARVVPFFGIDEMPKSLDNSPRVRAHEERDPSVSTDPGDLLLVEDLRATHKGPGTFVRRRFEVLHGVSLRVRPSETIGIVGESGSGKSTLARILAGLHPPAAGSVVYGGYDLAIPAHKRPLSVRRELQIIFQNPETALNPTRRVGDVLRRRVYLFERLRGSRGKDRVAELLEAVGLPRHLAGRRPAQLSGGQKQRVAIARALIGRPQLLICDEILSSLDIITQATILRLLESLREAYGLSLLFISHDIGLTASIAHRIVVFKDGEIREHGRTEDVMWNPKDEYTAQLVRSSIVSVGETEVQSDSPRKPEKDLS